MDNDKLRLMAIETLRLLKELGLKVFELEDRIVELEKRIHN